MINSPLVKFFVYRKVHGGEKSLFTCKYGIYGIYSHEKCVIYNLLLR
jgi:hypothetical protein